MATSDLYTVGQASSDRSTRKAVAVATERRSMIDGDVYDDYAYLLVGGVKIYYSNRLRK